MNGKSIGESIKDKNPNGMGAAPAEEQVAVDGYQQVLEMLKIADPDFRESLLQRLAARDRDLARALRANLAET